MSFVYLRCNIKVFTDVETRKEKRLSGSGEGRHGFSARLGFRDVAGAPPTGGFAFPRLRLLPLKGVWKKRKKMRGMGRTNYT